MQRPLLRDSTTPHLLHTIGLEKGRDGTQPENDGERDSRHQAP